MRHAVANAVKSLKGLKFDQVDVASPDNLAQSAAEAAKMTTWSYKESAREKMPQNFSPYSPDQTADFERGLILAEAQNLARELMELPGNLLTPSIFAEKAVEILQPLGVKVSVKGADWIKEQNMNAFWSVAKGSSEEPKFVEMIWDGENIKSEKTFCLVGKVRETSKNF